MDFCECLFWGGVAFLVFRLGMFYLKGHLQLKRLTIAAISGIGIEGDFPDAKAEKMKIIKGDKQ